LKQKNHKAGAKYIGYVSMANRLHAWRKDEQTSWLKKSPAHPLQQTLRDEISDMAVRYDELVEPSKVTA